MREYKCDNCKGSNLKLWREYNTFADHTKLLCASCLEKKNVDKNGQHLETEYPSLGPIMTYVISHEKLGLMVPAIAVHPFRKSQSFWGYTSVPDEDIKSWQKLSTYE